jgi:hypothetical protein
MRTLGMYRGTGQWSPEKGDALRLPAQLAGPIGTSEVKQCTVGEKCFVLGRIERLRQEKNLLYRHNKEGLLDMYSLNNQFAIVSTDRVNVSCFLSSLLLLLAATTAVFGSSPHHHLSTRN